MVHVRLTRRSSFKPNVSLILFVAMIALLWVAGGASRANVMGQVVVRAGTWAILIAAILAGPYPRLTSAKPVLYLLVAAISLPLVQLVPLPPAWWQALPGRAILLVPGEPVPWRPWTMTPGATRNALASLIVPVTMLVILMQADERARRSVPTVLVTMIGAATLLGLLQVSGMGFNNPLLNDTPGVVSSIFANRNHFALLLAMGCLITPVWAFTDREKSRWRGPLAAGLTILFVLTLLATGSRAGMLLGSMAIGLALLLVGKHIRRRLSGGPRWLLPALVIVVLLVIGGVTALSFAVNRAEAINRFLTLESGEDMRGRALPTVLSMIATYMPFGSGFGSFDPIFRIHEPFGLLKLTYFNQAHNDYLGIALDGGVGGVAVLVAGIIWWSVATLRVWRAKTGEEALLGRLGSAAILLILTASITDYPARTPTIMALIVVGAMWLAQGSRTQSQSTLP